MRLMFASLVALSAVMHTHTAWIIPTATLVVEAPSVQQEPYPGQSHHAEPPKEWFCQNPAKNVTPAHACTCKNMKATPDDPCCTEAEEENTKCKSYCYKDHCHCQLVCQKDGSEHHH